ncbi:GntR family transcriptional regulator [Kordiimonas sediminis]|uniref:GntR family transcriptional regulator n=1 Tax=Kordiimonas sediminis TaxID=1735581 RepID=A0A919APY9_9PROT|nr:GntR family transcriptional regulator [Kordiimonas sediminis]GHF20878.1 GntR family transcriptional regulator [Kordiimonas sediminis]
MPLVKSIGPLEENERLPLYHQLQRKIQASIEEGVLSPGDALPAEREIASELGISRITVRKALNGLVKSGFLSKKQGAGTFVTTHMEKRLTRLSSFTEDLASRGWVATNLWLSRTKGIITPEESLALGLGPGTAVMRFKRVRIADDRPMAVEYATVPAFTLHSVDDVQDSLYTALEQTGHRPIRAIQRIRAVNLTRDLADHFHLKEGAASLLLERRGYNIDGHAVEFTRSYYRGDLYDLVNEFVD